MEMLKQNGLEDVTVTNGSDWLTPLAVVFHKKWPKVYTENITEEQAVKQFVWFAMAQFSKRFKLVTLWLMDAHEKSEETVSVMIGASETSPIYTARFGSKMFVCSTNEERSENEVCPRFDEREETRSEMLMTRILLLDSYVKIKNR